MPAIPELPTKANFTVELGPERVILSDGLQPFMFRSNSGALVLQAQLRFPPRYVPPERNAFPGIPGTVVSRDGGNRWEMWNYRGEHGYGPTFEGAATALRDGTILLVEWIADGPASDGTWFGKLWESSDDFQTVSDLVPMRIHLPQARCGFDDGGHPYGGLTFHRSLLEMPDGSLLTAAYCWFEGDTEPCPYRPSMCKLRTILLRSNDRGRSWEYATTIAVDPSIGQEGFNEPALARVSRGAQAGRLVCIMRTGCFDCPLYQSVSDDNGATWSKPRELPFCGVDPDLIETGDGTLVLAAGWRTRNYQAPAPSPEHGNYLVFSFDGGDTWCNFTRVPFEPAGGINHNTSYTAVREIAPGELLLAYDIGSWGHAVRHIAGRNVRLL